jgi:hypothetical protein
MLSFAIQMRMARNLRGISLPPESEVRGAALQRHLRCASFSHMVARLIDDRFEQERLNKDTKEVDHVTPTEN